MNHLFENLNEAEIELVYDAIPLITILIAGADGSIDKGEVGWGTKITKIRSYSYHNSLQDYYKKIGETYQDKLDNFISQYPDDPAARNQQIADKLKELNPVIEKMNTNVAKHFYDDLKTFAEHVAKASGGFMGFGSISKAEREWMDLPMINPVTEEES